MCLTENFRLLREALVQELKETRETRGKAAVDTAAAVAAPPLHELIFFSQNGQDRSSKP